MARWTMDSGGGPYQDTALICLSGHIINSSYHRSPEFNTEFCKQCGAKTISACPKCGKEIQGKYHVPGVVVLGEIDLPKYCHACGAPYPWTESKLKALREFFLEEGKRVGPKAADLLGPEELDRVLEELVKQGPGEQVAAHRLKRLLEGLGEAARQVAAELLKGWVSDAVRKFLFG